MAYSHMSREAQALAASRHAGGTREVCGFIKLFHIFIGP